MSLRRHFYKENITQSVFASGKDTNNHDSLRQERYMERGGNLI